MKTFLTVEEANAYVASHPVVAVDYKGDSVVVYEPGDALPEVGGDE